MPDYPILQQNKPIGTLSVTQAGLFTVFSARAKADADRLRLAVCGEQARAYLGLMLPDGSGWLTLRKAAHAARARASAGSDPVCGRRDMGHSGRTGQGSRSAAGTKVRAGRRA